MEEFLKAQVADLRQQELDALKTLHEIRGALKMAEFLLKKLLEPVETTEGGDDVPSL